MKTEFEKGVYKIERGLFHPLFENPNENPIGTKESGIYSSNRAFFPATGFSFADGLLCFLFFNPFVKQGRFGNSQIKSEKGNSSMVLGKKMLYALCFSGQLVMS